MLRKHHMYKRNPRKGRNYVIDHIFQEHFFSILKNEGYISLIKNIIRQHSCNGIRFLTRYIDLTSKSRSLAYRISMAKITFVSSISSVFPTRLVYIMIHDFAFYRLIDLQWNIVESLEEGNFCIRHNEGRKEKRKEGRGKEDGEQKR